MTENEEVEKIDREICENMWTAYQIYSIQKDVKALMEENAELKAWKEGKVGVEEYYELKKENAELKESHQKLAGEWTDQTLAIQSLSHQASQMAEALEKMEGDYSFLNRQIKTGTKILELVFPDYAKDALTVYRTPQKQEAQDSYGCQGAHVGERCPYCNWPDIQKIREEKKEKEV